VIIRVCLVAALLTPAAAMAQGNPGPYGRLFGRIPAQAGVREHTTVEIRSSIGANYDSVLLLPEGSPTDIPLDGGITSGGTAVLGISHRSSMFLANVSGGASRGQYFTQPSSYGNTQYFANAQVSSTLTTRFDVYATAGYNHSPYYEFFTDFGRQPLDPNLNVDPTVLPFSPYATVMLENETVDGKVGLTGKITKTSSIGVSGYKRQTRFANQPDDDLTNTGYDATWTWQLSRDLGVHAGYGRHFVDVRGPDRRDYEGASIDAGVDYNKAFSIARRTTLRFNTATSVVKYPGVNSEFRVNGGVSLSKSFRRTWQASAAFNRATSFVPGFFEPLYTDSVGASLGGMFSRRVQFSSGISAARGESAFSDTTGFSTYSASATLSFAIFKNMSAYTSYATYWYEVPPNAITLTVPGTMARQIVSVGINLYVPVYEKVRQGQ
jgi:hypothetical protein